MPVDKELNLCGSFDLPSKKCQHEDALKSYYHLMIHPDCRELDVAVCMAGIITDKEGKIAQIQTGLLPCGKMGKFQCPAYTNGALVKA